MIGCRQYPGSRVDEVHRRIEAQGLIGCDLVRRGTAPSWSYLAQSPRIQDKLERTQDELEHLPRVMQVLVATKPYKLASREFHPDPTIISIGGAVRGRRHPGYQGPCLLRGGRRNKDGLDAALAVSLFLVEASGATVSNEGRRLQAENLAVQVPVTFAGFSILSTTLTSRRDRPAL